MCLSRPTAACPFEFDENDKVVLYKGLRKRYPAHTTSPHLLDQFETPYQSVPTDIGQLLVSDRTTTELNQDEKELGVDIGIHVFNSLEDAEAWRRTRSWQDYYTIVRCECHRADFVAVGSFGPMTIGGDLLNSSVWIKVKIVSEVPKEELEKI